MNSFENNKLVEVCRILNRKNKKNLAKQVFQLVCASYFKTVSISQGGSRKNVDIFVNPSYSDIKSIRELCNIGYCYVRYIADPKNKKIFIWDGENGIHAQIAKAIGLYSGGASGLYSRFLCGTADIKGNRLIPSSVLGAENMVDKPEFQWVENYLPGIIKEKIQCPKCGKKSKQGTMFCFNCGTRLSE